MVSRGVGAFKTTAIAPWNSACKAMFAERVPCVSPPPTPQITGMSETDMIA